MTLSWIPDPLKKQIADAVLNFIGKQAEDLLGEQIGDKIKGLSSSGALRKALAGALERGAARFEREYADIDEDLTAAILASPGFWEDEAVRKAILALASRPATHRPEDHEAVVGHFASVLPARRNRERVDRAVAALLGMVAEELWTVPGASEVREIYTLQMQRLSAESLQQQVALLRANLQATTELGAEMRLTLFQLAGAAEQRLLSAPAAAAPPARPRPYHNMPQRSYGRFIGRQDELEKLTQRLQPRSRHFLVTLDGIGGVGKSTLALECAHRLREGYASQEAAERFEAIIWVSAKRTLLTAAGIQQREQTFSTLGDLYRAIGTVLEQPAILQADTEQRRGLVERALTTQRTLLVIDNLETVDDEELLSFLRELPEPTKAIVTTRHRIDIAYAIRLTGLPKDDAMALMAIEAARKNVELPVEHADDLFRRTGGIPLAIVWSIGLMSLGHGVEAVLRRLGSGHSDIARFCFSESMAGLQGGDTERLLLALALFEASVSRAMLGEVAGLGADEIGRDDGLALLEQLSLVNKEGDRFSLLPLTRAFAVEALRERPELEQELRGRWVTRLIALAEQHLNPEWRLRDLAGLRQDGIHLVAAAAWARETQRVDDFLVVLPALMNYYDGIGDWGQLSVVGHIGLNYLQLIDRPLDMLRIENLLAWILSQQGRHEKAEQYAFHAYTIARGLNSAPWQIDVIQTCSQVRRRQHRFAEARKLCEQGLKLIPEISPEQQHFINANIVYELGKIARDECNWPEAERYFLEAQAVYNEDVPDPIFNLEWAWGLTSNLGLVAHRLGQLDVAAERYQRALKFFRSAGSIGNVSTQLVRLADLEVERGNDSRAYQYAQEGLDLSQSLGLSQEQEQALAILARLKM